jgi:hypothetical protein
MAKSKAITAVVIPVETAVEFPEPICVYSPEGWRMHMGDSVKICGDMDSECIDYSVFSPPFSSLYTYTDDERDMGNCLTREEFFEHFAYLIPELYRVTKPGRLLSFHCMNLPASKEKDGYIGLHDFRGELIRAFQAAGWIFHSEVCIWKDPVTAMQRTKAIGLLHKQVKKNRNLSRQGIADYFVTMRKPGETSKPIAGLLIEYLGEMSDEEFTKLIMAKFSGRIFDAPAPGPRPHSFSSEFSVFKSINIWQRYASPVWMDIDPGDTLQYTHARTEKDERHICPLQLGVIERGIELWSNPGDVVLSPFAGIGSEGHQALKMGRRFEGVELKPEYFEWACKNLKSAELLSKQLMLAETV